MKYKWFGRKNPGNNNEAHCENSRPVPTVGLHNERTRREWLARVLADIPVGQKILDAGAGECQFKPLCSHLDYTSQDFSQYDGVGSAVGLQTGVWDTSRIDVVSDISAIPLPATSFDVVMCTEVLEHVPSPVAALTEFSRLLKLGGLLILTAPYCSLTHFAPYHFSSGFNRFFYRHHLDSLGFEIIELSSNGNFFEYLAQEVRRVESVAAKYARSTGPVKAERKSIEEVLALLEKYSSVDNGSDELLCFGFHVLARKVR